MKNAPSERSSMTVNIEDESGIKLKDTDEEAVALKVIEAALDHEGCPYEAELNLLLTDNGHIRQFNREYREIDRETDVLSFPMLEFAVPGDFSAAEEDVSGSFNPDTGELILGDIILSMDKVREQADRYGHSEEREYAFLITHSMLHLCGYDHMMPEEAAVMEKRQREILDMLQITRQTGKTE